MIKLLILFWSFVKIGFTSFGGLSMIPLISSEMISNGFMTSSEVSDIVAIAEMTPGPLGLNCATFAGMRAYGILGAIVANLGALSPTLTVAFLASVFFEHAKNNKQLVKVMVGVRPACVGMVAGVIIEMSQSNYIDLKSVFIGILDLILLMKFKISIPLVILMSAVLGIIFFGFSWIF